MTYTVKGVGNTPQTFKNKEKAEAFVKFYNDKFELNAKIKETATQLEMEF